VEGRPVRCQTCTNTWSVRTCHGLYIPSITHHCTLSSFLSLRHTYPLWFLPLPVRLHSFPYSQPNAYLSQVVTEYQFFPFTEAQPNAYLSQLYHHNMSYKQVANFQDFMGVGREGSYSSNKENNSWIVTFWLSVPTNAIVHSPLSERRSPGSGVMTCCFRFSCCPLPL